MLKEYKMSKELWGEVMVCAAYLLNQFSLDRIEDITSKKAWSLRKPRVEHSKIFGCVPYAKVLEERRTKLENKSQKCIFIGYRENSSGYKLYYPIAKKVVWSVNVKFD